MLFNIWHPSRTANDEVTFDVTRANAPSVASGDPDWIAACLDVVGVSVPASEWKIQATRCYFYSDYPNESEWEDRWPLTWTVRVTLDGEAPSEFDRPNGTPYQISQYDETWEYNDFDPDHDRIALLLVLVDGQREDATTVRDDLRSELSVGCAVGSTGIDAASPDLQQVRALVRGDLFPGRTGSLETVIQNVMDRGHAVNRYDLLNP